jgi:hypothetical protein
MKKISLFLVLFLGLSLCRAAEVKDLVGKWEGYKGEFRWQIERFENKTFTITFRYSNVEPDIVKASGTWFVDGDTYGYKWLKSDEEGFIPDEEFYKEKVHSLIGGRLVTLDPPEDRYPNEDYINVEIKVTKFGPFDLTKPANTPKP